MPRRDAVGAWRYDFRDPVTGDRRADLFQNEAVSLKADLDAAAGIVRTQRAHLGSAAVRKFGTAQVGAPKRTPHIARCGSGD